MSMLRPFASGGAVGQVVCRKEICFGRVVQEIVARVDARVKVSVDKSRRNETASSIERIIHGPVVSLADKFHPVALENHNAVAHDLVLPSVERDHESALNQSFHPEPLLNV